MACYHPWKAVWHGGRAISVSAGRVLGLANSQTFDLPCGRCIGCAQVRQRAWAVRVMHECQMHTGNSFVTLTYAGDCDPSLNYRDWQEFMYRVRYRCGPTRFFMCGEYGELNDRPHFHAVLFGREFSRDYVVKDGIFGSRFLDYLWGRGFASHGAVTLESASYVAGYCVKKADISRKKAWILDERTGELVEREPEFGSMSLKPGIGARWFEKYRSEVYEARDGVLSAWGRVAPAPRFYDGMLMKVDAGLLGRRKAERMVRALARSADSTPGRLVVRERVARARVSLNRRKL